MPENSTAVGEIAQLRAAFVGGFIGRRAARADTAEFLAQYDTWEREAHVAWRERFPALTALLPSHLPAPDTKTPDTKAPDTTAAESFDALRSALAFVHGTGGGR